MAEKGRKAGDAKSPSNGIYKLYSVSGSKLERKNKYCPKCGSGFFMAQHKNRVTCGRCKYTEFLGKNKQ